LTLIKSISGIRGTIGGEPGNNFTPIDIVECTAGFGIWLSKRSKIRRITVGRDGRISGEMVSELAIQTLIALGFEVIDLGYSTTPTVEIAIPETNSSGGIVFTASHNPAQWNALKFLNEKGEFISASEGEEVLRIIAEKELCFAEVSNLGSRVIRQDLISVHANQILNLPLVNVELIAARKFHVVIDAINSTGAIALPILLDSLGVSYEILNGEINGVFSHNPEPLPEHLVEIMNKVPASKADLGIVVDPDVDRLAFIDEKGNWFGEEYTLVAVADYILSKTSGNTVSNLSSTKALKDITEKHGGNYFAAAVGEVNVVTKMKEVSAIIGGEGNGGIIYPELHYGRDALVGVALVLSYLAETKLTMSAWRNLLPNYFISKNKIELNGLELEKIFKEVSAKFSSFPQSNIDGLKIDFPDGWIHLRSSNTEPIIRLYAEGPDQIRAEYYASEVLNIVRILQP